jgi:hypothetical protein
MADPEQTDHGDAKRSKTKPPGYETRAFGLPEHSVRALLALLSVLISGALLLTGRTVPEWWVAFMSVITAFYYKR